MNSDEKVLYISSDRTSKPIARSELPPDAVRTGYRLRSGWPDADLPLFEDLEVWSAPDITITPDS